MNQEKQQSFTSVISVDPYKQEYYKSISSHLNKELAPQYSKSQYAISYLGTKSFISALISVSKNIPEDDIPDVIENKVYEDLALDMAISYKTSYVEAYNNVNESNRFFHVFVVDPLSLEEDFKNCVDEIKYIDQIVPAPLLLKSLYTKEIIDDAGVHCFIYFQEDDTFFTIYNENEFVYTKSLKYSLKEIHQRFCELLGEQLSLGIFLQILSNEGLATTNKEYQKHLIKLFAEVFLHISDVLTYTKRAFEIEKIDHIYIGSELSAIAGLDEYSQTYLAIKSSEFNFNYGYTADTGHINQLHALMQLYTTLPSEQRYECNFSIFNRPPPFVQRESGKIILLTSAAMVIALIYPIMNWSLSYAESLRYTILDANYNEVHNTRVTREATVKLKEAHKVEADKLKKAEENEYNNKKNTLMKIRDVKVNYPMKAKHLTELTKDLNKYSILLTKISYTEEKMDKVFVFTLVSATDKKITELLEYLTKSKKNEYKFSLQSIDYNKKEERYISELKVKLL
ncbi:hypothetical protein KKA17_12160 [bacterium]|nr:hypothetical protein [bacterium]MBU1884477.1 hypothetical protein [bacterium]